MYGAHIACHLTRNGTNVESLPGVMKGDYPYFTQDGCDSDPTPENMAADQENPVQYITNIQDGSRIGYKYFAFENSRLVNLRVRGRAKGVLEVEGCGSMEIDVDTPEWITVETDIPMTDGERALYFVYRGEGALQFHSFTFVG